MKLEVKKVGKKQIVKKTRAAVLEKLNQHKAEIAEREVTERRRASMSKQNMEL